VNQRVLILVSVGCVALVVGLAGRGVPSTRAPFVPRLGDTIPIQMKRKGVVGSSLRTVGLDGATVTIGDLRGAPALVNVWATWCPPCRREVPQLQTLADRYAPKGLRVIGVSVDEAGSRGIVQEFVEVEDVRYEVTLDREQRAMDLFALPGLPATFLLDKEGVVRLVRYGMIFSDDDGVVSAIEELLGS
jgi:cytochrome c biogenesis protein CcmG, thiol:disulfide interchange protein DsbE